MRQVTGDRQQLELKRQPERIERGIARWFGSGSTNSLSTASAPISPTASRCGRARTSAWAWTMSAPDTVCSSPRPSCSISAACVSGSKRAPKRDAVLRTPFAIAFTRPRSAV